MNDRKKTASKATADSTSAQSTVSDRSTASQASAPAASVAVATADTSSNTGTPVPPAHDEGTNLVLSPQSISVAENTLSGKSKPKNSAKADAAAEDAEGTDKELQAGQDNSETQASLGILHSLEGNEPLDTAASSKDAESKATSKSQQSSAAKKSKRASKATASKAAASKNADEEKEYTVVQVAVNRALYMTFDYKIKGQYRTEILGCRIEIQFGRNSGGTEIGIVAGIGAHSQLPLSRIKTGILLDQEPLIQPDIFNTLHYASEYYHYPLGQCLILGLPQLLREGEQAAYKQIPGMRLKLDSVIIDPTATASTATTATATTATSAKATATTTSSDANKAIIRSATESNAVTAESSSEAITADTANTANTADAADTAAPADAAVDADAVEAIDEHGQKLQASKVDLNTTQADAPEILNQKLKLACARLRSARQRELLMLLSSGPKKSRELREQGFSALQENALIRAGVAERIDFSQEIQAFDLKKAASIKADPDTHMDGILHSAPMPLNSEQEHCLNVINGHNGYGVFLLHGITGSGKTEVYLQAIEHCLRQGKRALILVPEIALTPQTFKRFYDRFQAPVATIHSTLSSRERLDAFLDMKNQRAAILIGTRSALFTSIPDLGLIVIDEEHDSSFKQTDNLRYHARTLAIYRAKLCKCKVILGSATPSLESVYHAQMGHYVHLDLLHRAKSTTTPQVQIVDLRKDVLTDNVIAGIGEVLEEALGTATAKHQQALLFLNRRGFSHSMICHSCGHILMCPHCDNQLTVHHFTNQLCCHICNTTMNIPQTCPYCGAQGTLIENGLGTEQVETYLKNRFMDVGVARIDRDIITTKEALESALRHVRSHFSEILIGTQMLAKGHDFPDLTLVGILDVDSGLYSDDFHGFEYTSQLITQVAGRAGRDSQVGTVYIQTRFPNHPLLLRLIEPSFNYYNLALDLLQLRKEQNLPPYSYQALVMTNSLDREFAFKTLSKIMSEVENRPELTTNIIISPVEPDRIERRFNRFHFHVQLLASYQPELHRLLEEIVHIFEGYTNTRDLRFAIDVNPLFSS